MGSKIDTVQVFVSLQEIVKSKKLTNDDKIEMLDKIIDKIVEEATR